jgi:hypothetical protein
MVHPNVMNILHDIYNALLADVSKSSGFSEIREPWTEMQWVLHEAPKLEKHVLEAVENDLLIDLERFPVQLRRLARRSLVDPLCMRSLRQLLLFCYKAEVDYTDAQISAAYASFEATNREVGEFGKSLIRQSPRLLNNARRLCQAVLHKVRPKDIIPKHGPGASTTPKWQWTKLFTTIEALYPFSDYFSLQGGDGYERWDELMHDDQITAKIQAVPKDSRGPRLICVHPAESIWIQQGLWLELARAIELTRRYDCWPRGHVRFFDQDPNGLIALRSSLSGIYATIDLREASDRISETLVQVLFGPYYKYFGCCRAQKYRIGDSEPLDLHCYAPMGNATTFPVQSLVFWAICVASLVDQGYKNPNRVFVFGDDLIIPSDACPRVIFDLESFGLSVNRTKSFWRGAFRESCGVDAFNGIDVTPLRWKTRMIPSTLEDLQALSDLAMRFRIAGYEEAARVSYRHLAQLLKQATIRRCPSGPLRGRLLWSKLFKTNNIDHGGIAEYVLPSAGALYTYWHKDYQLWVTPLIRVEAVEPRGSTHHRNDVLESVCSLEHTARSHVPQRLAPRRVRLKRGWTRLVSKF